MFTGIVTDIGEIAALTPQAQGQLHRLRIATHYDPKTIAIGASISCSGVCLTAVATGADWFEVDAAAETLSLTTARDWRNLIVTEAKSAEPSGIDPRPSGPDFTDRWSHRTRCHKTRVAPPTSQEDGFPTSLSGRRD